jgi:hypothetical protein
MKIRITKELIEYVDIQLPMYKKGSCFYYKIYSELKCIQVCNLGTSEGIQSVTAECAFIDTEDCTKEEFDLEYDRISNLLNDLRK